MASYLVASYLDLKDVIFTIEKMIMEHSEIRNKTLLRKGCELSIKPLGDREGFIVQVKLPPEMSG
ncbi:MAG: hypothetical protein GY867_06310 [bacterium]|nr:hypothetical protein [bacterium]